MMASNSSELRITELEEPTNEGQQAPAARRELPGDLRDIVDKLEVRLEKAELKIKESSVEECAFPPYVPGSLPGKSIMTYISVKVNDLHSVWFTWDRV